MVKNVVISLFLLFLLAKPGLTQDSSTLLLDDFEGELSAKTVDFGSGGGASIKVEASSQIQHHGQQSLRVEYNLPPGGYTWVARGWGLDVKGAAQWLVEPSLIPWSEYGGFSFFMYGENSGNLIAFDIKDAKGEMWRFMFEDDAQGWKEVRCPFKDFFARTDWQPEKAEVNEVLDFPIQSFQFEPRSGKGTLYFDEVQLYK